MKNNKKYKKSQIIEIIEESLITISNLESQILQLKKCLIDIVENSDNSKSKNLDVALVNLKSFRLDKANITAEYAALPKLENLELSRSSIRVKNLLKTHNIKNKNKEDLKDEWKQ